MTSNYKRWMSWQISLLKLGLKKQCGVVLLCRPRIDTHPEKESQSRQDSSQANGRQTVFPACRPQTCSHKALDLGAVRLKWGERSGKRGWMSQNRAPGRQTLVEEHGRHQNQAVLGNLDMEKSKVPQWILFIMKNNHETAHLLLPTWKGSSRLPSIGYSPRNKSVSKQVT